MRGALRQFLAEPSTRLAVVYLCAFLRFSIIFFVRFTIIISVQFTIVISVQFTIRISGRFAIIISVQFTIINYKIINSKIIILDNKDVTINKYYLKYIYLIFKFIYYWNFKGIHYQLLYFIDFLTTLSIESSSNLISTLFLIFFFRELTKSTVLNVIILFFS